MVKFIVVNSCKTELTFEGNYISSESETDYGLYISSNVTPCSILGNRTTCNICGEKVAEKYFTKSYESSDFHKFFPITHYAKLQPYLKEMVQIIGICEKCFKKVK